MPIHSRPTPYSSTLPYVAERGVSLAANRSSRRGALLAAVCLPLLWGSVKANEINAPGALGADMLPAGRHAVRVEGRTGESNWAYDNQENKKPLFSDYDNLSLTALLPPGSPPTVTHLQAHGSGERFRFTLGYGWREDVTVGVLLGWGKSRNEVTFSTTGVPTAAFQNLISSAAYGYKPVASATWDSMLDPIIGLRWRIDSGPGYSTILAPSLRIGLAAEDDPDNLMDLPLEDGSTDILLGVLHVRQLGTNWDLKLGAQYNWQLPDHVTARARATGAPLVPVSSRERMERDKGDMLEASLELGYRAGDWRWMGRMDYARDEGDDYTSPTGLNVTGLEANTGGYSLTGWAGVSWNGISRYLREKSGFPAVVSLLYRETLDGRNVVSTRDLYLSLTTVF